MRESISNQQTGRGVSSDIASTTTDPAMGDTTHPEPVSQADAPAEDCEERGGSHGAAVLFVTHTLEESVRRRWEQLEREAPADHDVFLAVDADAADRSERRRARTLAGDRLHLFDPSEVTDVAYPSPWADPERPDIVPGNMGLLYLHLAGAEPGYSQYWFVEYDVAYTGSWSEFFEAFRGAADVVGTTLQPHATNPSWYWWDSVDPVPELDREDWFRGFFPVIGVSRAALDALEAALERGWSGHVEAVLPTLARHRGLDLEDVGGSGPFVREGNRNRFYTNTPERETLAPGTFTYRPSRPRPGRADGTLWHPVKPDQGRVVPYVRLLEQWLRARVPTA